MAFSRLAPSVASPTRGPTLRPCVAKKAALRIVPRSPRGRRVDSRVMNAEALAGTIALVSAIVILVTVVFFVLFVRWSARDRKRRESDLESGR